MRLSLIDGIRGHLLLGMMLAHLAFSSGSSYYANALLNFHHFRLIGMYDAEFFVPISGFIIGYLLQKKWAGNALHFQHFLKERFTKVYKYQMVCALPILLFISLDQPITGVIKEFFSSLAQIIVLQKGFGYSDILPIYLGCFATLFVACRLGLLTHRKWLLVYFLAIYSVGQQLWLDNMNFVAFDILSWSLIFNVYFLFGLNHKAIGAWFTELTLIRRCFWLALSLGLWYVIDRWQFFPEIFTRLSETPNENWARTQLNPLYFIFINTLIAAFVLIMTYRDRFLPLFLLKNLFNFYFNIPLLRHIGAQSLQMFVAHVFIVNGYIILLQHTETGIEIPAAIVCIALFVLFAYRHEIIRAVKSAIMIRSTDTGEA